MLLHLLKWCIKVDVKLPQNMPTLYRNNIINNAARLLYAEKCVLKINYLMQMHSKSNAMYIQRKGKKSI